MPCPCSPNPFIPCRMILLFTRLLPQDEISEDKIEGQQTQNHHLFGKRRCRKTTVAAATALKCANQGLKTIVISIDIAHSLSDAFNLTSISTTTNRGIPRQIKDNLWVQEVDIQEELDRHWGEVSKYMAALLGFQRHDRVLAEEIGHNSRHGRCGKPPVHQQVLS